MTFVMPNFTLEGQDPSTYKAMLDYFCALAKRQALSFAPHEQDTPNMTVRLEAGAILSGVTLTEVAAQSTGTITAPSTHPRIDRVVIDRSTGAASVVAGTEASSPSAPAIPTGKLPVAQVNLTVGKTSITNADLTDERVGGGSVAIVQNLTSPSATDVPSTQAVVDAIAAIPTADATARDLAVMDSLLNQISLARASGPVPSGYFHLFASNELATKTNAIYESGSKVYDNPVGYTADLTTGGTALESGHQSSYVAANAFDKSGSTYWGSADPVGVGNGYIGYAFGAGVTKHIRRMTLTQVPGNYITSVKVQYSDNGSSWTDVGTTYAVASGANTIDLAASSAHRYWRLLANDTFHGGGGYAIGAGWGVYEVTMMEYNSASNMTLIPTAITSGAAPNTVDFYMLHKAVDATTLNTDLKARVSRDNGSNWSAYVTLATLCAHDANYNLLRGTADLSALASGTSVKWEITTYNAKSQQVCAVAMLLS